MRKSFTRLSSLLVLLLLSIQMVLAAGPQLATGGLSPTDGGAVSPNNPVFTMTFKANVQPGLLQIIGLYNRNGVEMKAIQLKPDQRTTTVDSVYFTHPDGVVTFKGKVVKIKFNGITWTSLQKDSLWITVGASAIQDATGNLDVATVFDGGDRLNKWDFTVLDLTYPTALRLYPKDDDKDVSTHFHVSGHTPSFAIHFSEIVRMIPGYQQGLGDFALYLAKDESNTSPQEGGDLISVEEPDLYYYGGAGNSSSFDSLIIEWDEPHRLPNNSLLYVRVKPGIIEDLVGLDFAGMNNETKWNFNTKDDLFEAPVISSETHSGSCTDAIYSDGLFYIDFDSDERLKNATTGNDIPDLTDLKAFIRIVDKNGNNIPIKTAILNHHTNRITVTPTNILTSSGISFTVTFLAGSIKDASGNLNLVGTKTFDAGNWDAPSVVTKRVTNQGGTTMDFLISTTEACAVHYIVVRKDPALDPTKFDIFGHYYDGSAAIFTNLALTALDSYYRIDSMTTGYTPLVPNNKFDYAGNFGKFYGRQLTTGSTPTFSMVEIFAEGDITIPRGNFEVLKRITGLPATHGITDSPASYYEIWFELIDTICTQGKFDDHWYVENQEHISTPQVMDGSSVYTTDILMPEAWFDGDTAKVAGVLINKDKKTPPNYGSAIGRVAKDGNLYINFNEPIRKANGAEFSSDPATQSTELKACLWVMENTGGAPGSLNADTGWGPSLTGFTASLSPDGKKIIIDPLLSWTSGYHVWVKIKNSTVEDLRGNEIVPYNNLYTQEYRVEWYTPPLVRYTKGTIRQPLDSALNVTYNVEGNPTKAVEPITVTVSSKIYVYAGCLLETGVVPAGTLVPFVNDTTKLAYIGNFFKIRKGTSSTVTESFGDPLERRDFTFAIDYTYGDSTKITITPKKQYDSEIWYFVQLDGRVQDDNQRTINEGAAIDNDSWRPTMFKLRNALTGNARTVAGWTKTNTGTPGIDDNKTAVFKSEDSRNPVLTFFSKRLETNNFSAFDALPIDNLDGMTGITLNDTIGVIIDEYVSLGFDHYIYWDNLASKYVIDANAMRRYFKVFDYDSVAMEFDVVQPLTILPHTGGDQVVFYIDPYYVNTDGTRKLGSETANYKKAKSYWVYFNSKDADDQGIEGNFGKEKGVYWDTNHNLVLDEWAKFSTIVDATPPCIAATITPAPGAPNLVASAVNYITVGFPYTAVTPLPCLEITENENTVFTVAGELTPGNTTAPFVVRFPVTSRLHSDSIYDIRIGQGVCGPITINSGNASADAWPAEACNANADSIWRYVMVDETPPALDTLNASGLISDCYDDYLYPQDDSCEFDKTKDIVLIFNEEVKWVNNKRIVIYDSNDNQKAIIYAQQCHYGKDCDDKTDKHVIVVPSNTFASSLEYETDYHINIDNGFVTDLSYLANKWAGIWVADLHADCVGGDSPNKLNDWSFRTGPDPSPYITALSPKNGSATTAKLTITFSEEVFAHYLSGTEIKVFEVMAPGSPGLAKQGRATLDVSNTAQVVKVAPNQFQLAGFTPVWGKQYCVLMPAGAFVDGSGDDQPLLWGIDTTGVVFVPSTTAPVTAQTDLGEVGDDAVWYVNYRDDSRPYAINNWPRDEAMHVPYNAYIYIEFSESVSLNDGSAVIPDPNLLVQTIDSFLVLSRPGLAKVPFDVEFVGNNKRLLRITPMDPDGYNYNATGQPTMRTFTRYNVFLNPVPAGIIYRLSDAAGNILNAALSFDFTTEDIIAPVLSDPRVTVDACTNKFNFTYDVAEASDTVRVYWVVMDAAADAPTAASIFAQNTPGLLKKGYKDGKDEGTNPGVSFTVDMGDQHENPSFILYAVAKDLEIDIWKPASSDWDSLFFFDLVKAYGEGYDRILDIMPAPNVNNTVVPTSSFMVWDNDAPDYAGSYPHKYTDQFPVDDAISFWFSEKVKAGSVNPHAITLRRYDNNIAVACSISWPTTGDNRDSIFTITPLVDLDQETRYYVEFDRYAIQDTLNTCAAGDKVYYPQMVGKDYWFWTADTRGPRLAAQIGNMKAAIPADEATCVSCPDLNEDGMDSITVNFYDANEVRVAADAPDKFVYLYRADEFVDPAIAWLVIPAGSITVKQDATVDTLWHVKIPVTHQYYPNDEILVVFPDKLIEDKYENKYTNDVAGYAGTHGEEIVWNYTTCNTEAPVVDWTVLNLTPLFNFSYNINPSNSEAGIYGRWDKGYREGTQGDENSDSTEIPTHIALKVDFGEAVAFNTAGTTWEPLSNFDFDGVNSTSVLTPTELMNILKIGDLKFNTTVAASDYDTIVVAGNTITFLFKYGNVTKLPVYDLLAEADSIDGDGLTYLDDFYGASLKSEKDYPITVTKNKVRAIANCVDNMAPRYVQPNIVTLTTRDDTPPTVDFKNAAGQSVCGTGVCVGPKEPITISFSDSIVKTSYDVKWLGEESYSFDNLPLRKDDLRFPIAGAPAFSPYFELCQIESKTDHDRIDTVQITDVTLGSDLMNYVVVPKYNLVSEGWYELVFKKFTVKKYEGSEANGTIYEGGDTCRFFVGDYEAPEVSYQTPYPGEENVGSDTKQILVTFNEGVRFGNTTELVKVRRLDGSVFDQFTTSTAKFIDKNATKDSLAFPIPQGLEDFTTYYIEMPEGFVVDDNAVCDPKPFAGFFAQKDPDTQLFMEADWSFTTSDSTPPELISVLGSTTERSPEALFPKVGSTVATNSDLVMILDENIEIDPHHHSHNGIVIYHDNGDLNSFGNAVEFIPWSNFYTHHADGQITITGSNPYDGLTSNVITINPNTIFDKKGTYYVRVNGDDIEDGSENEWSESTHSQLDAIKDREWYFSIVNDAAPVLVATSPAYDGTAASRTYFPVPADDHGFVKTDLSMTFKDALNGDPIEVAPGSSTRMIRIFEYTYDAATAQFKSKPWLTIPVTSSSVKFNEAGLGVVTIKDVILRDGIDGRGTNLLNDSVYYVTVDPGAIVNGLTDAQTWWPGINNGFIWRFQTLPDDVFVAEPEIVNPLNGAEDLTIDAANNLIINFGEGIEALKNPTPTSPKVQVFEVGGTTTPIEEVAVTKAMITGKQLNVPLANLVDETNYYVVIQAGAFGDTSTVSTPNTQFGGENVWAFQTGDNTPPVPVEMDPTDICVEAAATLTMTFDETRGVTKGTGTLTVTDAEDNVWASVEAADVVISEDGNTVTAMVDGLPDSTVLTVKVPAGFLNDGDITPLPNPIITWTFKTGENTAPTVVITPAEVGTPDAVLTLTFSEMVAAVGGIEITVTGFDPIDVDSLESEDGIVFTYLLEGLSSESTYNVSIPEGAFIDVNDGCVPNMLAAAADSFTVGDITAPLATGTPTTAADYVGLILNINFTDAVTPTTGDVVIYTAAGVEVERIDVNEFTASAGKNVYTYAPKNVKFGEYYILIEPAAFVDSSAAPIAQACPGIVDPEAWPLVISDAIFDNCIVDNSKKPYWGEINVPLTTTVEIEFCTERLAPGTGVVTIGNTDQSIPREINVTYFEYPVTAEMIKNGKLSIPVSGLKENTTYSIIIPYGAITDEAGNPFKGITDANAWIFTTKNQTLPTVTVVTATVLNDGTGTVAITSSEVGIVYLAKDNIAPNAAALLAAIATKQAVVGTVTTAGVAVTVNAKDLLPGKYVAYGFDEQGGMGTAANFVTVQSKPEVPVKTIKQIQGEAAASPLVGTKVRTTGTVTKVASNGFYMQDANAAWSGIFVSTTQAVSENSSVEIVGTVSEISGLTTIESIDPIKFIGPVVTAINPLTIAKTDAVAEMHESVLIQVTGRPAVGGTTSADWTIKSTSSINYIINNALYGAYVVLQDNNYSVNGLGTAANKVLAVDIYNVSVLTGKLDISKSVKVYPNPFDKYITLAVSNDVVITKAVITNIAGQLVKEVINPNNTIPTSELRSGVYFISLHTVDGIAKTERIIKR